MENHIVGAPCGVMDQMASACGEADKLLAMVCQVHMPQMMLLLPFFGLLSEQEIILEFLFIFAAS